MKASTWRGGRQVASQRATLKRFESVEPEPDRVQLLRADHPALTEGRTLFPSTVVSTFESPRFLVSGHNSRKIGKTVEKGPWKGMPIYTLALEERRTCPRSCPLWNGCYTDAMHLLRRHDAFDPDFMPALKAEVVTLGRSLPGGFVVRLHVAGDFFSAEYVQMWADLLDVLPNLRVFGYTARRVDADDLESRRTALALRWLTEQAWDSFAIRWSNQPGPQGAIVVNEPTDPREAITCPAQTHKTDACATCGLCWAPAARSRTIAFLRHGKKSIAGVLQAKRGRDADLLDARFEQLYAVEGMTLREVALACGFEATYAGQIRNRLIRRGVAMRAPGRLHGRKTRGAAQQASPAPVIGRHPGAGTSAEPAARAEPWAHSLAIAERDAEIAQRYAAGEDVEAIAKPFGISAAYVRVIAKRLGARRPAVARERGPILPQRDKVSDDERALIDDALAKGVKTDCRPGYAFGASPDIQTTLGSASNAYGGGRVK